MIKILFVFALIGAAFTLPSSDSLNQRYPVQIKASNVEPINFESSVPVSVAKDLIDSADSLAKHDENLEPAESFGFGYGVGFGGWGNGHGRYYDGRGYGWGGRYGGYDWGGRYGRYGSYGRKWGGFYW